MAVSERSVGPLYLAVIKLNQFACPVHRVGVVEMVRPWRSGHAVVFPLLFFRGFVFGRWERTIEEDIEADFADDRWLNPQRLDNVSINDISNWDGNEETKEGSTPEP